MYISKMTVPRRTFLQGLGAAVALPFLDAMLPALRAQMEAHRANPACANCHKLMDPLGFALENFDGVGAWRSREGGAAIDASSVLADGTNVNGVVTLRQWLLGRPDMFVGTVTEKMMIYALGRGLTASDMPTVRAVVGEGRAARYSFSSIVLGIVTSTPFQMRMKPYPDGEDTAIRAAAAH